MASFDLDFEEVESLQQKMEEYGSGAQRIINDVLHGEGGQKVKEHIHMLVPSSGRSWKGKRAPAAAADSLQQMNNEMLAVTIKTKKAYQYLYFPDDGSDTKRHAGMKQFFQQGAEDAADNVVDLCLGKLTDEF